MKTKYKVVNGTSYHRETPDHIINVLESVRNNQTRITVSYGDIETGRDWNEVYDITGTIGRSTGDIKIPLLVHNRRSMGGCALLDHCIVKIVRSRGKTVLYQHPKYYSE